MAPTEWFLMKGPYQKRSLLKGYNWNDSYERTWMAEMSALLLFEGMGWDIVFPLDFGGKIHKNRNVWQTAKNEGVRTAFLAGISLSFLAIPHTFSVDVLTLCFSEQLTLYEIEKFFPSDSKGRSNNSVGCEGTKEEPSLRVFNLFCLFSAYNLGRK